MAGLNVLGLESGGSFRWRFVVAGHPLDTGSYGMKAYETDTAADRASARPTMIHEPLYPILLSLVLNSTGSDYRAVVVVHALLHTLTTLLVFLAARRLGSVRLAHAAAALAALDPTLITSVGRPAEENLSALIFSAVAWFMVRFYPVGRGWQAVALGGGMALLSLSRVQGVGLTIIVAVFAALFLWRERGAKVMIRQTALFAGIWVVVISPWVYRNWKVFGGVRVGPSRVMWTLCEKTAVLRDPFAYKDLLPYAVSLYSTRLSGKLFPRADSFRDQKSVRYCSEARGRAMLARTDELYAERVLREMTVEWITNNPLKYFLITLVTPVSFLDLELEALSLDHAALDRAVRPWVRTIMDAFLRFYSAVIWLMVVVGAVRLTRRPSREGIALVVLVAGYLIPHVFTRVHGHFFVTVLPSLLLLGVHALPGWVRR